MSEPEINSYLDEFGSIKCSVTNKGVLLGEDEQKFIVDRFAQLRDENAKLREEIAKWERLAAGIDLPEYPVTQFKSKDLERENAKLRELVRIAVKYCDTGTCDECPIQGESGSCPYSDMARELGVEVDG